MLETNILEELWGWINFTADMEDFIDAETFFNPLKKKRKMI